MVWCYSSTHHLDVSAPCDARRREIVVSAMHHTYNLLSDYKRQDHNTHIHTITHHTYTALYTTLYICATATLTAWNVLCMWVYGTHCAICYDNVYLPGQLSQSLECSSAWIVWWTRWAGFLRRCGQPLPPLHLPHTAEWRTLLPCCSLSSVEDCTSQTTAAQGLGRRHARTV